MDRQYELVLLGASGYTGRVTCEHIVSNLPTDLQWAIAGRSAGKLSTLAKELQAKAPDRVQPEIEVVILNQDELDDLAKKTKLIITMVGPYVLYGTPVVEACAKNGTHYIDVTGETPWVRKMIDQYHGLAEKNGAIIIPQAGFESVPSDIMAYMLVSSIRESMSTGTEEVILSYHKLNAGLSGGTLATFLVSFEKHSIKEIADASQPWALTPIPGPSYKDPVGLLGTRTVPGLGDLAFSFNEGPDRAIVHRSWALYDGGRIYGPRFHFSEYMRFQNVFLRYIIKLAVTLGVLLMLLAPVRALIKRWVYAPGTGPTNEEVRKQMFEHRAIGIPESNPSRRAFARMRWDGGTYTVTGIFASEAAMVILRGPSDIQAKKLGGGILTPATLGQPFIDRLSGAGVVVEQGWMDAHGNRLD